MFRPGQTTASAATPDHRGQCRRHRRLAAFMVAVMLLAGCTAAVADEPAGGWFGRLKGKLVDGFEKLQDGSYLAAKIAGKAISFITSKAAGLLTAAVGLAIGTALGGPLAAGIGALIGYRIGSSVAGAVSRPWGEIMASRWFDRKSWSPAAVFKSLDVRGLLREGVIAGIGSVVGEIAGIAIGVSLLSGVGTFALPLLGVVSGAFVGQWVGERVGRWAGSKLGRKLPGWMGKAARAPTPLDDQGRPLTGAAAQPRATTNTVQLPAHTPAIGTATGTLTDIETRYRLAYQNYVALAGDASVTPERRASIETEYRQATAALQAARTHAGN